MVNISNIELNFLFVDAQQITNLNEFKEKLFEPLESPIVGNLINQTELEWPTKETFKNLISKKSVNLLQNTKISEDINFIIICIVYKNKRKIDKEFVGTIRY